MLCLSSPAKINLFLKVIGKRPDGFHELASCFQAISLADRLSCVLDDVDYLTCSDPELPVDRSNLVLKAADLFRRKTGIRRKLRVHLEKQIPQQAGLGGGSSNAATTLWAYNQLCGCPATEDELLEWSAEIGSDVPFFFSEGTAFCTGRGEKVKSLSPLPLSLSQQSLWIAKPRFGLSTPEVFRHVRIEALSSNSPESALDSIVQNRNPQYFNDLEEPAFAISKDLREIKEKLLASGFSAVLLSGSGTSFFCLGDVSLPHIPELSFFPATFSRRAAGKWYD